MYERRAIAKRGKKPVKPDEVALIGKRWKDTDDTDESYGTTYRVVDVYWDEEYDSVMVQSYDFDEYKYKPPAKPHEEHTDWDFLGLAEFRK